MQPVVPPVQIDRVSPVPLYFQVAVSLEQQIESGQLPVGTRLENEVDLADSLGVSRPTMRRAIQYLVDRGMLVRKRGVGTEVVSPTLRRPVELTSLYEDLSKKGRRPRTELVAYGKVPAPDVVARSFGMAEGDPVVSIERVRYAEDEPLALMHNYLPPHIPAFESGKLVDSGLYPLLRDAGIAPSVATEVIGARAATAAEARRLGERRGAPLLTMVRTAYDAAGRPVEYGSHVYRASLYSYELTLTSM